MKTLALLAAVAAVATAVPTLPGYNYGYRPVHNRFPAQIRREKKSPQLLESEIIPDVSVDMPQLDVTPEFTGRTFALKKKPIIVKKKFGYHLYRDSDEEMMSADADPQEKCGKEIKVKLCDAENLKMRSADEDSSEHSTEKDMKQSIKMAKEAVENLQKITKLQKVETGPDAELHEDIEIARQALEHIQQNFGNLEAMNLQATTLSEAEALQGARFNIAKTDSERMAQWKEAIDNIQKNSEIARNIEDSFEPVDKNPTQLKPESSDVKNLISDAQMLPKSALIEEKIIEHDHFAQGRNAEIEHTDEMVPSASEHKETTLTLNDSVKAKDANEKSEDIKSEPEATVKEVEKEQTQRTNVENDISMHVPVVALEEKSLLKESLKAVPEETMQLRATENIEADLAPAPSESVMKAVVLAPIDGEKAPILEKSASIEQQQGTLEKPRDNTPLTDTEEKTTSLVPSIDTTMLMKSTEMGDNGHNGGLAGSIAQPLETSGNERMNEVKSVDVEEQKDQPAEIISEDTQFTTSLKSAEQLVADPIKSNLDNHDLLNSGDHSDTKQMKSSSNEDDLSPSLIKSADQHITDQIKASNLEDHQSSSLLKSADQHVTNQMTNLEDHQFPPFMKSADQHATNQMTSSNIEDHQFPPFMKSADQHVTNQMAATNVQNHQLPPFLKSADQRVANQMAATNIENHQLPPFLKSADQHATNQMTSSNLVDHQFPPFMKSADQHVTNQMAATNVENHQLPPFLKSADQHVTNQMAATNVENHQLPPFLKSADQHVANQMAATNLENHQLPPFMKSADQHVTNQMAATNLKSADQHATNQMTATNLENRQFPPFSKSADQVMRSPESTVQQQFHEPDVSFKAQENRRWPPHADNMKEADLERDAHISIEPSRQFGPMMHHHGQIGHSMGHSMQGHHHMHQMGPHHHHHHHSGFMGKSVDMDSATAPSTQVNVNDMGGKAAIDHANMMQWKQKEAARGAYGPGTYGASAAAAASAGAGSGPGAVGVFPGASVGGCAVPLLLSCSPNVVSGNLVHGPAYSAPHAYKTAEFGTRFHKKRDVISKKISEITTKVKRASTKPVQRIPIGKKL